MACRWNLMIILIMLMICMDKADMNTILLLFLLPLHGSTIVFLFMMRSLLFKRVKRISRMVCDFGSLSVVVFLWKMTKGDGVSTVFISAMTALLHQISKKESGKFNYIMFNASVGGILYLLYITSGTWIYPGLGLQFLLLKSWTNIFMKEWKLCFKGIIDMGRFKGYSQQRKEWICPATVVFEGTNVDRVCRDLGLMFRPYPARMTEEQETDDQPHILSNNDTERTGSIREQTGFDDIQLIDRALETEVGTNIEDFHHQSDNEICTDSGLSSPLDQGSSRTNPLENFHVSSDVVNESGSPSLSSYNIISQGFNENEHQYTHARAQSEVTLKKEVKKDKERDNSSTDED